MLRQSFQQKLLQKLSPAQIQLMKLLQLPITALEQRIKEEMETNPALEDSADAEDEIPNEENDDEREDNLDNENEDMVDGADNEKAAKDELAPEDYLDDDDDIAYYKTQTNNKGKDEEKEMPMASSVSFQDLLFAQLENLDLTPPQTELAEYLLGCIDEDGYLRRELGAVADDLAFSQNTTVNTEELGEVLKMIQDEFDPAGIGAKDLQECLRLQLDRKKWTEARALALKIVNEQMEEFSKKHYSKIARHFDLTEEQIKPALDEILKLNPRPGGSAKDTAQRVLISVIPDFILLNNNGVLEVSLHSRNAPDLRVSNLYSQMLKEYSGRKDKTGQEATQFVKQKIEGAKSFISNIKERQNTLFGIMECIVQFQKEYFLSGDELLLKPMILKDISDKTGLDISTISRVTSTKYVQTNFGTILLKSLFNEALTNEDGEDVSSKKVKKIIADAIESEDKKKPLNDDLLTKILNKEGYNIARRTVAKYREMMAIPVARMRKKL